MVPRENENNPYAKFGGDKQRVLWYFPKWPIGDSLLTSLFKFLLISIRLTYEIVFTVTQ